MATSHKGIMHTLMSAMEGPLDPMATLVDNTAKLLDLLNKCHNIQKLLNKRDERGYALVHFAAERNRPESLKCLLIKEANPNMKTLTESSEVTPVHIAAGVGHLACLQLLVQLGGDVLARDAKQLTPIDHANINGQELCLNYLHSILSKRHLEESPELEDVLVEVERNLAANNLTTLAHWKLFNNFFPLAVPSAPTSKQLNQTESIMYRQCVLINNQELVKTLSRVAKDIPLTHTHCSLLHAAARYGRSELVRLIIEKEPQLALSVTAEGYNALHIAVAHRQTVIAKLLTQKQVQWSHHKLPPPEENAEGLGGVARGTEGVARAPEGVAKFGSSTMTGHTVLHFAVAMRDQESLRYILKHARELQLSVNSSECGYSPLHLAVFLNNTEAIPLLLRRGANPNTRLDPTLLDKLGISRSPLTEAIINKNPVILNLLLDGGADDRHHDALKVCIPTTTSHDLILPLLSSLVRGDDSHRPIKPGHRDRRIKMATVEWSNLGLPDLSSSDFSGALSRALFLRSQPGVDRSRFMDCVTSVNLGNNSLSTLPVELFQLSHLTTLNLTNNRLVSLPEVYKQNIGSDLDPYLYPCAALSKMNLSKNSLSDLPEYLFDLPNLSNLDLSHNTLRHLPFKFWKAPKLHTLNASYNSIEVIPTNWPAVLQECIIINTSPPLDQASSIQVSSPTGIKAASPSLKTPHDETPRYLTLSTESPTSTEDDPSEHEATPITKLQDRLNIANANLPIEWEKITSSEEEYEGLAILNLSNNLISEVPENLPCLAPKLKRLDLSHNQLSGVSLPRCFPSTLTNLYLSSNHLTEVNTQTSMAKPLPCTNPQVLLDNENTVHLDNITYCNHRSHGQLISLGVLEISNCQLTVMNLYTPQVVTKTPPATEGENETPDPRVVAAAQSQGGGRRASNPHSLRRLVTPLLTRLTLHHNELNDVPESVCEITSLTSLDLSHNNIIQLPANLGNLGNLWEFPLAGLKLISPPHNIIERGKTKDIIGFLWSLLQKARPYHRMKLMLVGKAARGKTTLLMRISERGQRGIQENWGTKRMRDVPANVNLSTVGIVVSDWTYYRKVRETHTSLKSITFMTWDFGGQEEYYATHQCFLSRRSLYLVVWNVTHFQEGAEELKPWLLNIQARAPHSPVLIVGTHIDKVSRSQRQRLARCVELIGSRYGTTETRCEGFPQIFGNFLVSCKSGRGISDLRDSIFDVASHVKENTVSGRGIGCGRIPEYRLLMDQLVPASYLQLEDTVKKIAFNMRQLGKPPVLTYKELRDHVFQDPHTLISKSSVDRELEQAVRFLHDNGTMLHYDDPLLCDLYFVDPQWLCDMLAHIITVREINPMTKDGIMKTRDLRLIFNDEDFPILWQREYIRLLTTFEVAVELCGGELLIPSTLPTARPNLPQSMFPEEVKLLPPLRHVYIVPFIPSGFWPRLISRLLTDGSVTSLARIGCGLSENELDQLSWVKWRTGMILQYGNLKLLSVSELDEGLFPGLPDLQGIRFYSEDKWKQHKSDAEIFGINIEVPDVYPILKYPEVKGRNSYIKVRPWARRPPPGVVVVPSESHDKGSESHDKSSVMGVAKQIRMDQVETEFQRLVEQRGRLATVGAGLRHQTVGGVKKSKSVENLTSVTDHTPFSAKPASHVITEDAHDRMRVGLLSKVVEHITLLVEDWFVGVRPRTLVVPCPHCSANQPHEPVTVCRSFSAAIELLPGAERREREWLQSKEVVSDATHPGDNSLPISPGQPYRPDLDTEPRHATSCPTGEQSLSMDPFAYAFRYNDCVVTARNQDTMFCPAHGNVQLQFMAPDTLFLTQGKDVIVKDVTIMDKIGQGAFATVYRAKYRRMGPEGEIVTDVAVKALTKEFRATESTDPDAKEVVCRAPTRHSIVEGFSNLKKELSILSPLEHLHVIGLFGVMLRPLGLVLELAPQGSVKDKLKAYLEAEAHVHVAVLQPFIIQLASAIQYLHSCNIIYRDLKSDNVLVWRFPDPLEAIPKPPPGQQLGMETVFVKLSDYGISQFAATQGARGLVGTPGFISPEILKYQGREVYTHQVDIFSFGMLMYELITLHIPYENLNAQQANQANERGTRPPLTKKDFPCPVLLRELMVWCWQQKPEHRPTADAIIAATRSEQFPRLLDGIRACNTGQVTSSCVRVTTSTSYGWKGRRIVSPSIFSPASRNSLVQSPQPLSLLHQRATADNGVFPLSPPPEDSESSSPSGHSPSLFSPQRRISIDEPRSKYLWSPRISDQMYSPFSDDEQLTYELWVCSSDAHHSTAAVMEYSGRFTNVEDIELGDSAVLSMCAAGDKVWLGFEIGYLIVFDANTKKPYIQSWVKQHKAILSMVSIPALKRVIVGLADGTVYAYSDDIGSPSTPGASLPSKVRLTPLAEYSDPTQSSSCFLVVPQGKRSDGGLTFELWVGQKRGVITILDAETFKVIKFVRTTMDMSKVPSYTAYLSYAHLVCGMSPDYTGDCAVRGCVTAYGALYHGQFVSRWDTVTKKEVDCINCQTFMEDTPSQDCCISSLLYSHSQLYVGLTIGIILIFEPFMRSCLGRLTCHRSTVHSLLTLDLSITSSDDVTAVMSSMRSESPLYASSDSHSLGRRSPTLSSLGVSGGLGAISRHLISVGSGFKSYFDGPESEVTGHSGFLLVWDSEHWKEGGSD